MSPPFVSIIIPCYNAERYVGEAIQSALDQTYAKKEVIVIDDGSDDESLRIIQSFGAAVRCYSGENRGAAGARNKGVALAKGELLQFLDADDLLHPDKLEVQVPVASANPGRLVFCDAQVIEMESKRVLGTWGRTSLSTIDPVIYVLNSVLQTSAPLHWKNQFVAIGGFREDMPPCEDPDLHLRLACTGIEFHHLPQVLYTSRRVAASLSKGENHKPLLLQNKMAWDAYVALEKSNGLSREREMAFAGFIAAIARRAMRYGFLREADDYFEQAKTIHPDGGIPQAYGNRARQLRGIVGSRFTEQLVKWKRSLFGPRECA